MIKPPLPKDENLRLIELAKYEILDSKSEASFDDLTLLASEICKTKISLISLIDKNRQWFKSKVGLIAEETPRDISWCGYTILGDDIFEVEDSELDERFSDNPLYLNEPKVRFYAGAPLISKSGFKLGTLCVIDNKPMKLSEWQRSVLIKLAKQVVILIESRLREQKLLEAKSKLDTIVNNIPIMLSSFDEKGNFEWVNNEWVNELGWDLPQMEGIDMLSQFYPDPKKKEEVLNFMLNPKSKWCDFKTRKHDGSYFDTSWTNVKLPNGKSIGIGQNIHERKILEKLSFDLGRMAKIGGWELIIDTQEVKWTEEVYRIHGITMDEKIDLEIAINCYAKHERPRIEAFVSRAIEVGTPWDDEFEFVDVQGNFKWVRAIGEVIKNDQGKVNKLIGTFQDITEKKSLLNSLEQQKKISQQQSKLASVGRLAAGVGHEINNPLAIIKGYLFAIREEMKVNKYEDAKVSYMIEKIDLASDRIAKIVNGLRTFSRSDVAQLGVFNINEALEGSFNLFKEIYHKEGITLSMNINTQKPMRAYGNKGRIEQVIINLFSNAKDATIGQVNRIIEITLEEIAGNAKLTCRDNGKGISDDIKERIFDPFFTTKDVNQGTGIGLSIVSSIIKEHDGEIYFKSILGEGTTFIVEIPLNDGLIHEHEMTAPVFTLPQSKILLNALIVDDEEDIRNIMGLLLSRMGIKTTVAENGKLGLEAYHNGNYDIIITDLKMPVMDGITFIEGVRSMKNTKQPKVILMTGGVDGIDSQLLVSTNLIDTHMYKPFDEKIIYEKIQALFPQYFLNK
jgi:PAS domain S-box-containing protein